MGQRGPPHSRGPCLQAHTGPVGLMPTWTLKPTSMIGWRLGQTGRRFTFTVGAWLNTWFTAPLTQMLGIPPIPSLLNSARVSTAWSLELSILDLKFPDRKMKMQPLEASLVLPFANFVV
jgi:hypothetical protein